MEALGCAGGTVGLVAQAQLRWVLDSAKGNDVSAVTPSQRSSSVPETRHVACRPVVGVLVAVVEPGFRTGDAMASAVLTAAAALDSVLTERQIAVYSGILVLGQAQGHFALQDPPRLLAAMEDGYQMEVLAGRRTRTEVITALRAYARAVTGHEVADPV